METVPDGVEVVATRERAAMMERPPLLIVDAITEHLDAVGLGRGPISWSRIGDGQSNITFKIQRGDDSFVLRRGPRPPIAKSTHNMVREARMQRLLRAEGVPVPEVFDVCTDAGVLGVPFYVMEHLHGIVITDELPRQFDAPEQRRAISLETIRSLVRLHQVDVTGGGISGLGRPEGYLRRQVARFGDLWNVNSRRNLPQVALIGSWLERNRPESQAVSVVHGDYRIGNLMFAQDSPVTVVAILDWEMATLGDPLSDLGYLTATYAEKTSTPTPMELTSITRERGFPGRDALIEAYRKEMPLDLDPLPWYQALALWKAAIFCEAIYTRWLDGERPDDVTFGPSLAEGVPQLLEAAGELAGIPGVQRAGMQGRVL